MYLDGFEVDPAYILRMRVSAWNNNVESCEVLASTDKPMEHTYNANLMCFASLPCTEFRPIVAHSYAFPAACLRDRELKLQLSTEFE